MILSPTIAERLGRWWQNAARAISQQVGSAYAFACALFLIVAWLACGFVVGFSNTLYQLIINTVTTIITFLMVFILQHSQNRDTLAIQMKLDELIRVTDARNELRGIEKLPEDEIASISAAQPHA